MFVKIYNWDTPQATLENDSGGEKLLAIIKPEECTVTDKLNMEYSCKIRCPISESDKRWESIEYNNFMIVPNYKKHNHPQIFFFTSVSYNYANTGAYVEATANAVFYKLSNIIFGTKLKDHAQATRSDGGILYYQTGCKTFGTEFVDVANSKSAYTWSYRDATDSFYNVYERNTGREDSLGIPIFDHPLNDITDTQMKVYYVEGQKATAVLIGNQEEDFINNYSEGVVDRDNFTIDLGIVNSSSELTYITAQEKLLDTDLKLGYEIESMRVEADTQSMLTKLYIKYDFTYRSDSGTEGTPYYGIETLETGNLSSYNMTENVCDFTTPSLTDNQREALASTQSDITRASLVQQYASDYFSSHSGVKITYSLTLAKASDLITDEIIPGHFVRIHAEKFGTTLIAQVTGLTYDAVRGCYSSLTVNSTELSSTNPRRSYNG